MRQRCMITVLMILFGGAPAIAETPSLLKIFRRSTAIEADQSKSYELSETDGPWMILAYTHVGEGSKQRAEHTALEIRRDLNLPAFVYKEDFDFTGRVDLNVPTERKLRYANPYRYEAYAVLVGEYDRTDHPSIKGDLKRIRAANLSSIGSASNERKQTDQLSPIELVQGLTKEMLSIGRNKQPRPMGNAFVTRNPMLPQDYFEAPKVDSFVHQLNDGVPHSLLACSGKYTVVIKTFEGNTAFVDGKQDKKFRPNGNRLAKNSNQAAKMTEALRAQGVEAYQYHDRFRSFVTVGSFADLGRELPDGRFEYAPEIMRTVKKYSALNYQASRAGNVPKLQQGVIANAVEGIPFDVNPKPIIVPKVSKRSLYSAAFGLRN